MFISLGLLLGTSLVHNDFQPFPQGGPFRFLLKKVNRLSTGMEMPVKPNKVCDKAEFSCMKESKIRLKTCLVRLIIKCVISQMIFLL